MDTINKVAGKLDELRLDDTTPPWAKILIFSLGELINVVKANNAYNERMEKLEEVNKVREVIIQNLQEENKTLKEANLKLKEDQGHILQKTDENEQKSRSSCLLVHGVVETDGEDTDTLVLDIVNNKVGVELSLNDIERSHRIGPKRAVTTRSMKPRAIIFRFSSIRKKLEVFRKKKELKGTNVVITESLTALRFDLFQKAKTKYGIRNTWTSEGRIFAKVNNLVKHISSSNDLE